MLPFFLPWGKGFNIVLKHSGIQKLFCEFNLLRLDMLCCHGMELESFDKD